MNSKSLTSSRETPYFVCSVIVSAFLYIIATLSIVGIAIALILIVLTLISTALMLGHIRGNGVRVDERQFPDVYERVVHLSKSMHLKSVPDVFVIHSEGAFNAFATRFFGRNMVVIYSEVFELAREHGEKELDFIIAHELAHIKRRHIWKSILILPANFVPFLSQAYSRACEYTCDRKAAYYIQDGSAAKRALTILGIGKVLYKEINEFAYLEQINKESNVAVWFSEISSTHPILPKRIQAVAQFMRIEGTPNFQPNNGKIAIGATISTVALLVVYVGMAFLIVFGIDVMADILPTSEGDEYSVDSESDYFIDATPLMMAAVQGDIIEVKKLIAAGADIYEKDEELTTALHHAVYNDEIEVAEILLLEGADPNDTDDYSTTLTAALLNDSYEMTKLLYHYGADPELVDSYGDSALNYFAVDSVSEFEALLNDL